MTAKTLSITLGKNCRWTDIQRSWSWEKTAITTIKFVRPCRWLRQRALNHHSNLPAQGFALDIPFGSNCVEGEPLGWLKNIPVCPSGNFKGWVANRARSSRCFLVTKLFCPETKTWVNGNRTKNYLAGFGKSFQLLLSAM